MNICVYCGNSDGNDPAYLESARMIGTWIAKRGHTLVYGGCKGGLMGALGDAASAGGAQVIGVMPDIPRLIERKHPGLTDCVWVDSMAERKDKMVELSDAFIALPGGLGTLDEISDVFALARLGKVTEPSVLLDINGFYQPLACALQQIRDAGFMSADEPFGLLISDCMDMVQRHIEGA